MDEMVESSVVSKLFQVILRMSPEEQKDLLKELEKKLSFKKRRHERKPCISAVDYVAEDGTHTDFTQNISAGGVFIGTSASLAVGQEISLGLFLPVSNEHLVVSGEIAWVSQEGIGVKFKPSDRLQEKAIKSLVDMI
jgi:Tfp pilus assembly protein PilZ